MNNYIIIIAVFMRPFSNLITFEYVTFFWFGFQQIGIKGFIKNKKSILKIRGVSL